MMGSEPVGRPRTAPTPLEEAVGALNCRNCGAPPLGPGACAFCGTARSALAPRPSAEVQTVEQAAEPASPRSGWLPTPTAGWRTNS